MARARSPTSTGGRLIDQPQPSLETPLFIVGSPSLEQMDFLAAPSGGWRS